eukprot:PhM_4_TR17861/c0_g1_i1/m.61732
MLSAVAQILFTPFMCPQMGSSLASSSTATKNDNDDGDDLKSLRRGCRQTACGGGTVAYGSLTRSDTDAHRRSHAATFYVEHVVSDEDTAQAIEIKYGAALASADSSTWGLGMCPSVLVPVVPASLPALAPTSCSFWRPMDNSSHVIAYHRSEGVVVLKGFCGPLGTDKVLRVGEIESVRRWHRLGALPQGHEYVVSLGCCVWPGPSPDGDDDDDSDGRPRIVSLHLRAGDGYRAYVVVLAAAGQDDCPSCPVEEESIRTIISDIVNM